MNIIYKKVSELIPYVNNPRKNDKAVDAVASSIKNYGFRNAILIDAKNEIINGHTRLKAAKKLGMLEVPCVMAEDLTPSQVKGLRIADNKVAEAAEWDYDLLKIEFDDIDDFTGFDLDDLNLNDKEITEDDFNTDEALENIEEPITKRGDIWKLGNHRLMCGDSTSADDVGRLMEREKAKMLFTSPPYSDIRDYNGDKNLSVSHLIQFIEVYKKFTDYQVINLGLQRKDHDIKEYWNDYIKKAREVGYKFLAWNVWNKNSIMSIGQSSSFFPIVHEWIFVFGIDFYDINLTWEKKPESIKKGRIYQPVRQKNGSMEYSTKGDMSKPYKKMESVLNLNAQQGNIRQLHPAMFPVELPHEYIISMTNKNDIIIEPFGGSGTTLIASEQTERICYMMELDEKYCDVIIKRWETLTGKKAEKVV